jgi:beta-galactosidase/beta-glucuronidase
LKRLIAAFLFFLPSIRLSALDLTREIDLQGEWRFEIGDNLEYAAPDYDDSRWQKIQVPGAWENEGFPGYDGYAWYRITFSISKLHKNKLLLLKLGQIDDVDRTYFNGNIIGGQGDFPPKYQTAFDAFRLYEIPTNFIHFGYKNCLAVRVLDNQGVGGIVHGEIGVYSREDVLNMEQDLSGFWYFKPGDKEQWANMDFNDSKWRTIAVPGLWEQQGYPYLDGFAWYRKSFKLNKISSDEKLILMLGKINDIDQVFFNGVKIGETGFLQSEIDAEKKSHKDEERAYFIPPYLVQNHPTNTIAVRVFDFQKNGGIYSGYIGICTREEYLQYSRKKK